MANPLVSVLLPVHNGAATLEECLQSVQAQTLQNFEIVLINDGSTDNSVLVAERTMALDGRLRVIEAGRVGLVAALNIGLQQAAAPWVARLDCDDIALPQRLQNQADYLARHPGIGLVACQVQSFVQNGELGAGYARYDRWQNELLSHQQMCRELFVESPLAHPSVMFRRHVVMDCGGYQDNGWPEDYDLWLRLVAAGQRFHKLAQVLLKWRDHPGRLSRHHSDYSRDGFWRCKAHYLARGPLLGHKKVIIWGAGPCGRRLGRYLQEANVALAAFVDIDPRKIGGQRRGCPVWSPEALEHHADAFVLAAVGSLGARQLIRARLVALGFTEEGNFLCAA